MRTVEIRKGSSCCSSSGSRSGLAVGMKAFISASPIASASVVGDSIVLGQPFIFNKSNIDAFDF